MCYTGGPRCANHVGKELAAANQTMADLVDEAARKGSKIPDGDGMFELYTVTQQLQAEYDSTPQGQKKLAKAIAKEQDEEVQQELAERLAIAKERRDAAMAERKERLRREAQKEPEAPELTNEQKAARVAELESIVEERTSAPEFDALIAERDRTRLELESAKEESEKQKELVKKLEEIYGNPLDRSRDPKFSQEEVENARETVDEEHEKLRQLVDARYAAYCEYNIANDKLETYKDETARSVGEMNELLGDPGIAYEGETLGNCVQTAKYDSGTREWLEERAKGIGGSDIGAILKEDPEHGQSNYNDFIKSKTEKYTDEEVAEQAAANATFEGAAGRGNAWEPQIIREYMANNPNATVMYSKASWCSKDNDRDRANVDGLLSSDGETPDGILEIKTASDIRKWQDIDEHGNVIEKIPAGYRAQILWYLKQTGFKYADIAAKVDDKHYVQRRIYAGDPIDPTPVKNDEGDVIGIRLGTIDEEMPKINDAWRNVEARNNGTYIAPSKKTKLDDGHTSAKIERTAENVAAWTGMSRDEAKAAIKGYTTYARAAEKKGERVLTRDAYMVEILKKGGPAASGKDRVYVDIETSGMTPSTGEIIEIGIKRVAPDGTVKFTHNERFGVRDERTLDTRMGTGMVSVHGISPDDIRGKRSFRNPEVQKLMKEHLNDPDAVMIAHNDNFEKRWFNQHVDEFRKVHAINTTYRYKMAQAGTPVDPCTSQDTMWTSRYLAEHTDNNRLATFTTGHGIAYENAHQAFADSDMTHRAELSFEKKFKSAPRGLRYRPDGKYITDSAYADYVPPVEEEVKKGSKAA